MSNFSTIKPDILRRWDRYMSEVEVPKEAYNPSIRMVSDDDSSFTFGLMLNSYRHKRPGVGVKMPDDCVFCTVVGEVKTNWERNLVPEYELPGNIVIPNIFPQIRGASVAVSSETGYKERGMATTRNPGLIVRDLNELSKFTDITGLKVFHNSPGFGASIPHHEHWHLTDFGAAYDITGQTYGFDGADKKEIKGVEGVSVMSDFPFAHLIINKNNVDRIGPIFNEVEKYFGHEFKDHGVPHAIAEGIDGYLITFAKNSWERGIGSGDVAGHILLKDKQEFDNLTYRDCLDKLGNRLFTKDELNLERYL